MWLSQDLLASLYNLELGVGGGLFSLYRDRLVRLEISIVSAFLVVLCLLIPLHVYCSFIPPLKSPHLFLPYEV